MPDGECHPERPISVMEIHGTSDPQVPYDGGVAPGISDHSPSSRSVLAAWADRDHCAPAPSSGGDAHVQTLQWTGCATGTTVILQSVQGAGHNWFAPGLVGADASLDATDVVWQFFSQPKS